MKIDYLIKLGGSLLYDCSLTNILLDQLYNNKQNNIVVTVGSGYLGEMYKDFVYNQNNLNISFNDSLRDYSNIQSINASILSSMNENYIVCNNKDEINCVLKQGKIPIADARGFMSVFRNDKYQKSDARAAHICHHLECENLIIVTNVSGVYDSDPNLNPHATIYPIISAEQLRKIGKTSVDEGVAEQIIEYNLNCCVVGINNLILNYGKIDDNLFSTGTVIKSVEERGKKYE